MSYEPTNWKAGDTVTSAKLNKMEQGIAGGKNILIVGKTVENDITTLDKTWQEIFDADIAFIVIAEEDYKEINYIDQIEFYAGTYTVRSGKDTYIAQTADDYPVSNGGK